MQHFLDQANRNQKFHNDIDKAFPGIYNDWKITVTFYIAIHLLKALAEKRNVIIGNSHEQINANIKPVHKRGNPTLMIKDWAYDDYINLYRYSQTARYSGVKGDPEVIEESNKITHTECVGLLKKFRMYIESELKKTAKR